MKGAEGEAVSVVLKIFSEAWPFSLPSTPIGMTQTSYMV